MSARTAGAWNRCAAAAAAREPAPLNTSRLVKRLVIALFPLAENDGKNAHERSAQASNPATAASEGLKWGQNLRSTSLARSGDWPPRGGAPDRDNQTRRLAPKMQTFLVAFRLFRGKAVCSAKANIAAATGEIP
jgi:hypothetical protein